jgi:hypothetical protein
MSVHTEEELKAMPKHPKIKAVKKALDNLVGQKISYPIILEIQHEVDALSKKLEKLGY